MWLGSDGKLYAPGANVPAEVTKLTAQFALSEQFTLTPGGRYYFDLSAMKIPGNGKRRSAGQHAALCAFHLCGDDERLFTLLQKVQATEDARNALTTTACLLRTTM